MRLLKITGFLALLIFTGCLTAARAGKGVIDNSPAAKEKRRSRCKPFCNKQHYPDVKLTEADGTLRILNVHIVSINDKDVCACAF